jgi:arsenate reductase (glutaredoxin)
LLKEHAVPYRYREYTEEPLTKAEIQKVLKLLGVDAKAVLRRNDAAFKSLGLTGDESNAVLVGHMVTHPTLLQRPIGVQGLRAVIGRPPSRLLELAQG